MEFISYKVFRKQDTDSIKVKLIKYDSKTNNYFLFLEENLKKGNEQLILNTDFILSIMEHFFIEYGYDVTKINFYEKCYIDEDSIKTSLKQGKNNKDTLLAFTKKLEYLRDINSIDISDIILDNDKTDSKITVKSNGQITIGSPDDAEIVSNLIEYLENLINVY